MACIKKINKDYTWNCETPNDTLGGISEAILINSSDISLMTINQGSASIQLAKGTKGFVVESANNGINVAFAVKTNAVTSAGLALAPRERCECRTKHLTPMTTYQVMHFYRLRWQSLLKLLQGITLSVWVNLSVLQRLLLTPQRMGL